MPDKTFSIRTYGCQMNVRDSEVLSNRLITHGYVPIEDENLADIIIVNSCSVRGKAEDKALGKVQLLCSERDERPGLIVGLMGCMAQRLGEGIFKKVPGLSFTVGTRAEKLIPGILARLESGEDHICETGVHDDVEDDCECGTPDEPAPSPASTTVKPVTSLVTILLGCNRRCSYCIVPDVRGEEHSRMPAEILLEIRELAAAGVRDITLLGQSVMNYGKRNFTWPAEIPSAQGFTEPLPRLFELIAATIPEITRLRFTSGHPSGVTPELIRAMRDIPQVCPHLHLPMQSGSDRILKAMRRGYDSAQYLEAVTRLREAIPDIALTTDIIVGFPGETEQDFEDTRRVMQLAGFDNAFIFKYSPRPGTPSASMLDDVSEEEKMRRNQVLLDDQDKRGVAQNQAWIGRDTDVLAEGPSLRNATRWSGRSPQNKIVVFDLSRPVNVGDTVRVHITHAHPQTLFGDLTVASLES